MVFLAGRREDKDAPLVLEILQNKKVVVRQTMTLWGEKWGETYYLAQLEKSLPEGTYFCRLQGSRLQTPFQVEPGIFRKKTLMLTSVCQLEMKKGDKMGWQDCGSDLRAVEGHAVQLLGLVESFQAFEKEFTDRQRKQFLEHIVRGADYLVLCQRKDGSFVNEYYAEHSHISFTLCALAVLALTAAYEVSRNVAYLDHGKLGWKYLAPYESYPGSERLCELKETRALFGKYAPWTPPEGLRCRDLLLKIRCGAALYRSTNDVQYKKPALQWAKEVCEKFQFLDTGRFQGSFWGNFFAWRGETAFQRAWEHCGWGYGCGAVLPDDVSGILELLELFPEEEWLSFRYALRQYAYGFLKPACSQSPFGIYPIAVLENGEILFFGPAWHGFNGMYGMIARNAALLARYFEDPQLENIALDQLQFVAGRNPSQWEDLHGLSFINGVGERHLHSWTDIPGSISNGISASSQFCMPHADDISDGPWHVTAEDWIVHNGGWLCGLAALEVPGKLKIKTLCDGRPVEASVQLQGNTYQTNSRGVLLLQFAPPGKTVTVDLIYQGRKRTVSKNIVAGHETVLVCDFKEMLTLSLTALPQEKICRLQLVRQGEGTGEVRILLFSKGVKLQSAQEVITLQQKASMDIPYQKSPEDPTPCYLYAQAESQLAFSACEIDWLQEESLC